MKSELQIRYNVLVNHKFEKIADDYAIEFADWVDDVRVDRKILYDTSSIKQLLEIFKKEKGL